MAVKSVTGIVLGMAVAGIAMSIAACAPASLGSAPASEHNLQCSSHETLVCRSRNPTRLGKDEEQEYDYCTCESLDSGFPL